MRVDGGKVQNMYGGGKNIAKGNVKRVVLHLKSRKARNVGRVLKNGGETK